MRVEACCQRILSYVLPLVDEKREGICIDVGVGTFAFYCEMFSMLGFKTIAVEPLPVEGVRVLCQYDGITLIEACLSDVNGTKTIHLGNVAVGLDSNYASLQPDWFGVSTETREVQSLTLSKLLLNLNAQKVTCLKLDIEGAESTVITKLRELPKAWLPSIIMFEYGGGDSREKGQYGWSQKYLSATIECIRGLKECGYNFSIMIDNALDTEARIFDLQSSNLEPDSIFYPNSVYGNIIAFRGFNITKDEVAKICQPYYQKSHPSDGSGDNENVITLLVTEELELSKFQLYQSREELEQYKVMLQQTQGEVKQYQGEVKQYQSQQQQTQQILEDFTAQLQQAETLLQKYKNQLDITQTELEQSQAQLQQTQTELEQSQAQLQQTQTELEQSQMQLQETQSVLEQSQMQLQETESVLEQSQAQLQETESVLEQSQAQLQETQTELEQSQMQLQATESVLEQSQAQLQEIQTELEQSQAQLQETQTELEQSQAQLQETQTELEQSQMQLQETESVLEQSQAQLQETQTELEQLQVQNQKQCNELSQTKSQLHYTQWELEKSQFQIQQLKQDSRQAKDELVSKEQRMEELTKELEERQVDIERSRFIVSLLSKGISNNARQHQILVRDAWLAYDKGDLTAMKRYLQQSLEFTDVSKTEAMVYWVESFAKLAAENGLSLDFQQLTNLPEWQQLMRWTVSAKSIGTSKPISNSL
jgi:FkbM family methyltransferase